MKIINNFKQNLENLNSKFESHEKINNIYNSNQWTVENKLLTPTMKIKEI